ncbi:MAG: ROK family transcriptional regulator [Turicibacter sp.]
MKKIKNLDSFNFNLSTILEYLYRNPYTSRIEISNATGITPATVTSTISHLLEQNVIFETGEETSNTIGSGRKRKVITLNKNFGFLIGVDFNLTGFFTTITDICGNTIECFSKPYHPTLVVNINQEIISLIKEVTTKYIKENIIGIGISIPGHFDITSQRIISNNDNWSNFNLSEIKKEFSFPMVAENNVKSMALSQYLFNPTQCPDKFSLLHVGYGLFHSFIDSHHFEPKQNYYLGEIGHTVVDINGPVCECGKRGCLQTYISQSWILQTAKYLFNHSTNTVLHSLVDREEEITLPVVFAAYNLGDRFLKQYLENGITLLGTSIANSLIMQDASKIFLNSELFKNDAFSTQIINIIENQLMFIPTKRDAEIEILPFDPFRGARGACAVACLSILIKKSCYQFEI